MSGGIYVCIYVYTYAYIHTYIYGERERRSIKTWLHLKFSWTCSEIKHALELTKPNPKP